MKVEKSNIKVKSTVEGDKKIALSIDVDALAHIMEVLTNLYSDSELAIIREYSTNAYDAHVEAGQTRPIEVKIPNALYPFLTIRDYGLGLDAQDILDILSKYGASTKRDSNEYNGSLGLGCKSGLAYAAQFTLVGIKDGIKTTFSIGRDEDGTGSMTPVGDPMATNEPNGVEITIPARRWNDIPGKARRFFSYWKPGTVLLDGQQPTPITGLAVGDNMLIVDDISSDKIVMGNVPYPVDLDLGLKNDKHLVVNVPIGAVSFAPSREKLRMQMENTQKTIAAIHEEFKAEIGKIIQAEVKKATTFYEAVKIQATWREAVKADFLPASFTYKRKKIPSFFKAPDTNNPFRVTDRHSSVMSRSSKYPQVSAITMAESLFVTGYDSTTFTAPMKKKLKKYVEDNKLDATEPRIDTFVLCPGKYDITWMDPKRVIDWATIKKIKLPSKAYGGGYKQIPGSYDVYLPGEKASKEIAANDLPRKGLIYLIQGSLGSGCDYSAIGLLRKYRKKSTIVLMTSNREGKFKRYFPRAQKAGVVLKKIHEKLVASVSREDILARKIQDDYYLKRYFTRLSADDIDDPKIKEAVELLHRKIKTNFNDLDSFRYVRGLHITRPDWQWENPLDEYPLFDRHPSNDRERAHNILYLNAAYAADQEALCATA